MRTLAFTFCAALCVNSLPATASSPAPAPHAPYYVTDGRTAVAGPFRTYFACSQDLKTLRQVNNSLFCGSTWIRH